MKSVGKLSVLSFGVGLALSVALSPAPALAKDASAKAAADSETVDLDPVASKINWNGKKVTGEHHGEIKLKSGTMTVKSGAVVSGRAEIDMSSITDEDLKDPEYNKKLLTHLKSEDFFDAGKYPTATFVLKTVVPKKGPNGETDEVTGDLTIKNETHPVTFPATIKHDGGKYTATAHVIVDRTTWNINYGSGKFFAGLGDKVINDQFSLDLKLVTK